MLIDGAISGATDGAVDGPFDAAPMDAPDAAPMDAPLDASPDAQPGTSIVVNTTEIDFGAVAIAQTKDHTLVIQNQGSTMAHVSIAVTGARAIFAVLGDCYLAPGATCMRPIRFQTFATGVFTATVTLTSGTWSQTINARGESKTRLRLGRWGLGSITGPGINCTGTSGCDVFFTGDIVLTAVPDAGNAFVAWSDPTCGSQPTCLVRQEATGRWIKAYFAPQSSTTLNVVMAGTGAGSVRVSTQGPLGREIATCRTSCEVPVPNGATVELRAQSLSRVVGIAGACTGTDSCTFTATSSASATITFEKDPKELWTREIDLSSVVSASYDSAGNLIVLTAAFDTSEIRLVKLDPTGKTLWAAPPQAGSEVRIGANDLVIERAGTSVVTRDVDGYRTQGGVYSFSDGGPVTSPDSRYYLRRLMTTTDGHIGVVGNKNGVTNVQTLTWTRVINATSMQVLRATSAHVYVGVGNSSGGFDVAVFDHDGTMQPSITDAAPYRGTFDVLPTGEIVTASATTTAAALRRKLGSTTVFTRTVALDYAHPPKVGVVGTSGDRVFWVYSAETPDTAFTFPAGFVAEIVDATGAVTWSITRGRPSWGWNGSEVYDLTSNGTDVALCGGTQLSSHVDITTTHTVVPGFGFVQVYRP